VRRLLVALAAAAVVVAGCGSGGSTSAGDTTTTTVAPTTTPARPPLDSGTAPCPPATPPAETPRSFAAPKRCLEDGKDYGAVITTSEGAFTVDLLEDQAPGTVNNFVVLARWGWFDGDDFHRVVPGFVAQAGDRFGEPQGTGGPGYEIPDELPTTPYQKGSLAMANHGADTGGSQWFVCDDCGTLPGDYPLFGQVTEGLDVVDKIMALGVADGPPSKPIAITKVTITEQ
jgi:cyclophilin family peptidyl-prolyl cis-trans isomerase